MDSKYNMAHDDLLQDLEEEDEELFNKNLAALEDNEASEVRPSNQHSSSNDMRKPAV